MKRVLLAAGLLLTASGIFAEDPAIEKPTALTKATFSISGLHCPPCTRTVESSLRRQKGVKAVKVDWATKSAKVEFDEAVLPVQQLSAAVAATPHMMGGGLNYAGWLALSVPGIKDDASAKMAEAAVRDVKGVTGAGASATRRTLSVQLAKDGNVTSQQLIDALEAAGFKASNY
ncbi:MAG TPA: heavy metal-associated domain-containing protein [Pirellulales bacterium]|jgi:copper chaperone CopZ|nr:heavy metal-associated domain-containing protein [Pirellulales bacterium]